MEHGSLSFRAGVLAAAGCIAAAPAWAAPSDEIRALLEAGKPQEAYEVGRRTPDGLGDPSFDFYFGIAAIDAGRSGEGVLALERYSLTYPENQSARLQLARGHFALGEDARAREEFEALRSAAPTAEVAATIDRYLEAIRLRESRYTTSTALYLEAGLGYDTNVNGGVANPNVNLPNFGNVTISPAGTKNADAFRSVGLGGLVTQPIAPGVSLFANAQGELKSHVKDQQYDLGNLAFSGGISILRERNLFRFGLQHGEVFVENDRFRTTNGASAEWQRQLDERQSVALGGQYARFTYPGANAPRDADFTGISATYRRLFPAQWQPILTLSANAGREHAIAAGRSDLSRALLGARGGVSFTPAARWGASIGATLQHAQHRGQDAFLGVARRDLYIAADAAVSFLVDRNWSLRGEALISRNDSNIALYEFPRSQYSIKVRYEFI